MHPILPINLSARFANAKKASIGVVCKTVLLVLALTIFEVSAGAIPNNLQPLEDIPPPAIGPEGGVDEPEITIIKKGNDTVEEYRIGGELYMIKITPAHGKPYFMHKEDKGGDWINDGPSPPLSVPKWTIFRF